MKIFAGIFCLGLSVAIGAEQISDYAYGVPIDASGEEALYQVALPQSVYEGVARSDLGDVRVFNGAGEVVPFAWRPRDALVKAPDTASLTLFPLKTQVGAAIESAAIQLRRDASGAITVQVHTGADISATETTVVSGYLLDLQGIGHALQALEFDWQTSEDFVGKVRIDASDDLANWTTLVSAAPLVNLEMAGQRLQQKRVELPRGNFKYLRLSWAAENSPGGMPVMTAVRAEFFPKLIEPPRVWMTVPATKSESQGAYDFGTAGHMPVDRVRIELPEPNTIAQVEILSRATPTQTWRAITHGVAYRLRKSGTEVVSPDFVISGIVDRDWLLRVDQRGGGIGAGVPAMHVGWIPHHLVFAARGQPPFQLVYGNREAQPAAFPIDTVIPSYNDDIAAGLPLAATGPMQVVSVNAAGTLKQTALGGESRRQPPQPVTDWKRTSLWGFLVLGVLILGIMAWRLSSQLATAAKSDAGKGPDNP